MLLTLLITLLIGSIIAVIFSFNALFNTLKHGLPFVSTPRWAINWLRDNLNLTENDIIYELGCGDARIISALAKKYPQAKFVGIEVQWWPFLLAKIRTARLNNVIIINGDIFKHDLSPATMVIGFFITSFMPKLADKIKQNLQPGTTIISYGFSLPSWQTTKEISQPERPSGSKILFYKT